MTRFAGLWLLRGYRPCNGHSRAPGDGEVQRTFGIPDQLSVLRSRARGASLRGGSHSHQAVSNATFEALRKHFSEREIVEITWLNAVENYYNLINIPLEIESDGFCAIAEAQKA